MCCDISECTEWEGTPVEHHAHAGVPWSAASVPAGQGEVQEESTLYPELAFPILAVT